MTTEISETRVTTRLPMPGGDIHGTYLFLRDMMITFYIPDGLGLTTSWRVWFFAA